LSACFFARRKRSYGGAATRPARPGDERADYNLRRNKTDAAHVLLSLKARMLKEVAWKP
jgi:hypothetical protein